MSFIRRIKRAGKVYLAEVESVRVGNKVVQRHIRYVGKEVNGETVITCAINDLKVEHIKVFGPLLVLNDLAKSIGLHDLLGDYSQELWRYVFLTHPSDYIIDPFVNLSFKNKHLWSIGSEAFMPFYPGVWGRAPSVI